MSRPDDGGQDGIGGPEAGTAAERDAEWRRRRRLAEVFGDSLPDTTSDERDPDGDSGRGRGEASGDAWLRAQVPPHHGS